jgi:POT family proton-dependent oligopeptide transporter
MSGAQADIWYHNFTSFVYFTPIIEGAVADIFWGNFNTIIWFRCSIAWGMACWPWATRASADWPHAHRHGAEGIKPCVSAHVGDQFSTNAPAGKGLQLVLLLDQPGGIHSAQLSIPWLRDRYGRGLRLRCRGL